MKLLTSYKIFLICLFLPFLANSQQIPAVISVQQYISMFKGVAIKKMREHKIPASISLAQGILESNNGNSDLAIQANNHFGIKCHDDWTGDTYMKDDDEKNECFRKYRTVDESFEDHSSFLCSRPRYAFLFNLDVTDYKSWAYGLKKAGYATNPQYPEKLIKIIEENRLFEYDYEGKLPIGSAMEFSIDSLPIQYKEHSSKNDFNEIDLGFVSRKIWKNNRVKFTLAKKSDNIEKLARDLDLMPWQIYKYNELRKNDRIMEGQIIYVQPKRRRAEKELHVVKPNETIYTISQLYAIKMKFLCRKNRLKSDEKLQAGQILWLRKTRPDKS